MRIAAENLRKIFSRCKKIADKLPPVIAEFVSAVLILGIVMGGIWIYSGQSFPGSSPLVVIESGSMTHENEPFGGLGTIDPGDIVLAKAVHTRGDVITYASTKSYRTYGDYGDVIIYKPLGRTDLTPIIHRAMCWVEYNADTDTYTVEEYNIINATSVTIPELHLYNYKPAHSGFITKGDHNLYPDQHPDAQICREPVEVNWIIGKAQGELPWFGALKLMLSKNEEGGWGASEVPGDSWTCLIISIVILLSIPLSLDIRDYLRERKSK